MCSPEKYFPSTLEHGHRSEGREKKIEAIFCLLCSKDSIFLLRNYICYIDVITFQQTDYAVVICTIDAPIAKVH